MKLSFKQMLTFGAMLFGYGLTFAAKAQKIENKINELGFVTKEQLQEFGLVSETLLFSTSGKVRYLLPGERVQVRSHEEDNSIIFTTFDDYSILVDKTAIHTPRNVGNGDK